MASGGCSGGNRQQKTWRRCSLHLGMNNVGLQRRWRLLSAGTVAILPLLSQAALCLQAAVGHCCWRPFCVCCIVCSMFKQGVRGGSHPYGKVTAADECYLAFLVTDVCKWEHDVAVHSDIVTKSQPRRHVWASGWTSARRHAWRCM